jgi:hypothetical protein
MNIYLHAFLISELDGVVSFTFRTFYSPVIAPVTHLIGGWVGLRAGLDVMAKRKNPFTATVVNRTPVVQAVA